MKTKKYSVYEKIRYYNGRINNISLSSQQRKYALKRRNDLMNRIDDFEYSESGRIQGHSTVDGFFEPD